MDKKVIWFVVILAIIVLFFSSLIIIMERQTPQPSNATTIKNTEIKQINRGSGRRKYDVFKPPKADQEKIKDIRYVPSLDKFTGKEPVLDI
jgi:cytochrome c biogenesis protein ResB